MASNPVSAPDPHRRLDATVRGRVQGVGFRMFVLDRATGQELRGWVANLPDGSVRVVAEGPERALGRLLADLREGPRGAHVEAVDEAWLPASGEFERFGIRSGWHGGD